MTKTPDPPLDLERLREIESALVSSVRFGFVGKKSGVDLQLKRNLSLKDARAIARTLLRLDAENQELKESNRLYAEDFNNQGRKGFTGEEAS